MRECIAVVAIVAIVSVLSAAGLAAEDKARWTRFRGPDAGAVPDDPTLPDTWSPTENVAWKVDIPGLSWSSPIVWDDQIFITSAVSSGESGTKLLCGAGRGNLQVYDVSDPTTPVKAATFATPGRAVHVALEGSLAYVADGEAGIQVVDLSTPSQPKLVGTYETSGPARDVAVDSLVFVVVVDEEVLVLRQTR